MPSWTFITNHGAVLTLIAEREQVTAREIANNLKITERSVHRIITDLEKEGYIERRREGRVNFYTVDHDLPLRKSVVRETGVGELLTTLLQGRDSKQSLSP